MGEWRKDQAKHRRRYAWGSTRGENDPVRRDFVKRLKSHIPVASLRVEKIGPEIHLWRQDTDPEGKLFWSSCLRFVEEGMGYWSISWRDDEGRWRGTPHKELPAGQAVDAASAFFGEKFVI